MNNKQIEKAADEYVMLHFIDDSNVVLNDPFPEAQATYKRAFIAGAQYALSHQWISVEERLPEFNDRILVRCVEYGRPSMFIAQRIPHDTADRNNTRWHWPQVMRDGSITHWLPIPPLKVTMFASD